jgi:hypothetical protein
MPRSRASKSSSRRTAPGVPGGRTNPHPTTTTTVPPESRTLAPGIRWLDHAHARNEPEQMPHADASERDDRRNRCHSEEVDSPRKCARPSSPSGSLKEPTPTSMHAAA